MAQGGNTVAVKSIRVLVVEDDARLRDALRRTLSDALMDVDVAEDGSRALLVTEDPKKPFDVIILDIGLPDSDGRDVCQALRSRGLEVPVLFLTARGQVTDVVSGFAAGGDDYLAKPFHLAELVARVSALARRRNGNAGRVDDNFHLDPTNHRLASGGAVVDLTPTEYRILAAMLASPGRVFRRRELVSAAWPIGAVVQDNTLDQYVARIRRKLRQLPRSPILSTVHGVGYRLEQPSDEDSHAVGP